MCENVEIGETFHVEHIIASQHERDDSRDNLCLSCPYCNRKKGTNVASIVPGTRDLVRLFNPRTDRWEDHFQIVEDRIVGLTEIGEATVRVLDFNASRQVGIRQIQRELGDD